MESAVVMRGGHFYNLLTPVFPQSEIRSSNHEQLHKLHMGKKAFDLGNHRQNKNEGVKKQEKGESNDGHQKWGQNFFLGLFRTVSLIKLLFHKDGQTKKSTKYYHILGQDGEQLGLLYVAGENAKWYNPLPL